MQPQQAMLPASASPVPAPVSQPVASVPVKAPQPQQQNTAPPPPPAQQAQPPPQPKKPQPLTETVPKSDAPKPVSGLTLVTQEDIMSGLKNLKKTTQDSGASTPAAKPGPMSMSNIALMAAQKARERQAKMEAAAALQQQQEADGTDNPDSSSQLASSDSLRRQGLADTLLSRL